jgi:catechol 2,3-dioxygenase-like lactoylglutathione lyase family enzyme
MDVLMSRILVRPTNPVASRRFYGETLGLAISREFGPPDNPGTVYFLGSGFLEVSGQGTERASRDTSLWVQVRDLQHEWDRLVAAGVEALREPRLEMWGLHEAWIQDPDGLRIILVQIPADHPIRRDQRVL